MKRTAFLLSSLSVLALILTFSACASEAPNTRHEDLAPPARTDGDVYGRALFKQSCHECHEEPLVWSRDDFNWHRILGDNSHYWTLNDHDRVAVLGYLTNNN